MPIDTSLYTLPYIERRTAWRDAFPVMANAFATTVGVGSIIDVGCAGGLLVEALRARGYEAWGLDGAPASDALWPAAWRRYYQLADLIHSAQIEVPATEVVCSLEVAEHLPAASAPAYVALLTRHRPAHVLFTAAPVGQSGVGHINCQPFAYWIALFAACGYDLDLLTACRIREIFRTTVDEQGKPTVPTQYANNFLAFSPQGSIAEPDSDEGIATLWRELHGQRQLHEFLVQRVAHLTEFMALLRRRVGEPTEPSELETWQLRTTTF
jgi:hypothetical protein